MKIAVIVALAVSTLATPAQASEVFGGLYVHGVDTPLTLGGSPEGGIDFQLGLRGDQIIPGTGLEPHLFAAVNSKGDTSYLSAGLSWKFGDKLYVRPGLGLAVHNGSKADFDKPGNGRIEFGSRLLFAPELGIGVRVSPRVTVEASWVHLSHATIFSGQNPGIDNIGARLNLRF
ncbi:acyloxyacyl hydrolase [Sphingomonas xanthus]|uniref:Acyloxyacyl hydrolase n=1 Tax=Sphingomonas xanthus TaxID=2594473 RepID=A0A516IR38_9SPHN|nr:acyloxyacyl hydrolase [Sphingomonas xanthus]QDP19366.1 acyloxyacyl hydrolase [Sphingomonas xanthus]